MFQEGLQCPVCLIEADPFGDHQVGCGGNCNRILRHNSLRDAFFSAFQTAALAPQKEAPSLVPGTQCRPADVYLPCWKRVASCIGCQRHFNHATTNSSGCSRKSRSCPVGCGGEKNLQLMVQLTKLLEFLSFLWPSSLLVAWVTPLLTLFPASVVFWANVLASPPVNQHVTCSKRLLYLSGEVMQQPGSTAVHLSHHLLIVWFDSVLFCFSLFFFVFLFCFLVLFLLCSFDFFFSCVH